MLFCLILFISAFCINEQLAQTVNNVRLEPSKPYEFTNPKYPDISGLNDHSLEWNFQVDGDGKVKILCDDIRMVQYSAEWPDDCPHVYLSAIDGNGERKVCGSSVRHFKHVSDGSTLKLKVVSTKQGSALFKCTARSTSYPLSLETVSLVPNGPAKRIPIYAERDTPQPNLDNYWIFNSPVGTRLSFQCDITLGSFGKDQCGANILTFNDGETENEHCGYNKFVWFSKKNKAELRLQLDKWGHGRMECLIQAVTGSHPDEYMNVVSTETDSSEHGVKAGAKQTSCKCGWSNKSGARIINGEETRPNEYPWMVHLNIFHETDKGSWSSSCGASIITARHVLTAAHCVIALRTIIAKPENVHLILGKHDADKPTGKEITIVAEKIFVRDEYLKKGLNFHDIALIYTKQTIDFSTIIGPICIEREELPVINKQVLLMGWGLTQHKQASKFLKKATARVIDRAICNGNAWDVCTSAHINSFCSGDSGGPIVWLDPETNRFSQVSLVSRSASCIGKLSFSTVVSYFYDWIQEIIRDTDPSVRTCHKI